MNSLVHTCLLSFVVCCALGVWGSEVTFSTELSGVTGGPASGLHSALNEDEELELLELEEEPSGTTHFHTQVFNALKDERKKKKGKGKRKNRHKSKSTTALNPEHMHLTSGYSSASSTTENPCTSSHLDYCIHGHCQYLEGVHEPVCICMRGYAGLRCGIQTLETKRTSEKGGGSSTELIQTVLVVVAVVLSVISCTAIILMTCAHYRSHKNFLASYLGSSGTTKEQEKLQKTHSDSVV